MDRTDQKPVWQEFQADMPEGLFRRYAHQVVDWAADYLSNSGQYPVLSQVAPGEVRSRLPPSPPDEPEPMDQVLADFNQIIVPGITHWNHPGFLAYFAITGSAPGVLAEMLAATLNVNAMLWRTSPSATELEETVLDWLRQLVGMPSAFEGVIYDTASISSLVAIAAAREALGLDIRQKGMAGRPELRRLRLYCSEQSHSSIEKDAITLGIGQEGVRMIEVDEEFRMDPSALRRAVIEDVAAGWQPFCVVATVGTTSTTSVDPVPAIADICKEHHLWLHVDGAYAGVAAIVPELRWILEGVEHADSFVINPHKWLFTPVDLSAFYCQRLDVVRRAFALVPEYLRTNETEEVRNYMDYGPQLGRRFRALKLWFVLRTYGRQGIISRLREHIRLAQMLAGMVDVDENWERMAPTPFSTICFRARPPAVQDEGSLDRLNQSILEAINATGEALISHTRLHGKLTLRIAIGNLRTSEKQVLRVWRLLNEVLVAESSSPTKVQGDKE